MSKLLCADGRVIDCEYELVADRILWPDDAELPSATADDFRTFNPRAMKCPPRLVREFKNNFDGTATEVRSYMTKGSTMRRNI